MKIYTEERLKDELGKIISETAVAAFLKLAPFVNCNVAITPIDIHYHTKYDNMCVIMQIVLEGCDSYLTTSAQVKNELFAEYNRNMPEILAKVVDVEE